MKAERANQHSAAGNRKEDSDRKAEAAVQSCNWDTEMLHPFVEAAREALVLCKCAYRFTFHSYQLSGENKHTKFVLNNQ